MRRQHSGQAPRWAETGTNSASASWPRDSARSVSSVGWFNAASVMTGLSGFGRRGESWLLLPWLGVHFLPELRRRLAVDLFQRCDGAQDRGIAFGPKVTGQDFQGHPAQHGQVGHLRLAAEQDF